MSQFGGFERGREEREREMGEQTKRAKGKPKEGMVKMAGLHRNQKLGKRS